MLEAQAYADSLIRELRRKETVTVPQSEVVLKLPVADIRSLPRGAEFRDRSGQASAAVQFSGDTVYVFATCDSLQRMCSYYERTEVVQGGADGSLVTVAGEVEEEKPPDAAKVFLAGVLTGILVVLTAIGLLRR